MKDFNTERIELILIFAGVFLGSYLMFMGTQAVFEALLSCY